MERKELTDIYLAEMQWLLEESQDAAYIIDIRQGIIIYMNEAGKRVFGVGDDIVGQSPKVVGNHCWNASFENLTGNRYYTYEYYNDKVNVNFVVREKLVQWDQRKCVLRVLVGINNMENMERTLADKIHIENTLYNFINTLTGHEASADNDATMNYIVKLIGEFYSADRAYIIELNNEARKYSYSYEWCREGVPKHKTPGLIAEKSMKIQQRVYEKNMAVLIRDIEEIRNTAAEEYKYQFENGVHSIYSIPYLQEGMLKGFVGVDNPRVNLQNYSLLKMMTLFVEECMFRYKFRLEKEFSLYHDTLTGQRNQNGMRIFSQQVLRFFRGSLGVAVANINGLRDMNRDFGREYGDNALISFSEFLMERFKDMQIFRLDGDEFVVLGMDMAYEEFHQCIAEAEKESEKVLYRGASFGDVWIEDAEEADLTSLVHSATQHMIISKRHYYERYRKSSKYNDDKILKNLLDEMQQGHFIIYFQPKIDARKEELVGMEALIRYKSEQHGILPPGKFVPLLEKEGLICYIDYFVLEQACATLANWIRQGKKVVPISVNFSRSTIKEKDVVNKIVDIVKNYNIPYEYILVEITETEGDLDRDAFVSIGSDLIKKGIGISLDDFCSRYSCVSLLTSLPFQEVKFDKSMIDMIAVDNNMKILCESMMDTCNRFGYRIVAEGVETEEQLMVLRKMNCNTIQGYYYSRPISTEEFEKKYYIKK